MSDWLILGKYPFTLLPGEPKRVEGEAESYYEYLNGRPHETGKNVQCVAWLLRNFDHGLVVDEPFGGCGVFSVAMQEELRPAVHRIGEIDEECLRQLNYCMADYPNSEVRPADAHITLGTEPADIYLCDFPFFTLQRLMRGEWYVELQRMVAQKPKTIMITDGSAFHWHWTYKRLQEKGLSVTPDRESYAPLISEYLWNEFGYSITGCAYHSNCFYLRAEPVEPGEIEFKHFGSGTGPSGLRRVGSI